MTEGCDLCREEDGSRGYPMYGVAPHECYWRKGPGFTLGQSTLLPMGEWDAPFVPDLEAGEAWDDFKYPSACGVYYCPNCDADRYQSAWAALVKRIGEPPAKAIEAGTGAVHESAVP